MCEYAPVRRPQDFVENRHYTIHGRPALLLGGQLHNSTSSDVRCTREVFDRVVQMGGNAVTATVSWHLVEPEEGVYDFSAVEQIVQMAKERDLALTLLWFGAFKNAASTYAPRWVRADTQRFPRVDRGTGSTGKAAFTRPGTPVLSVFSAQLREADRRAFVALIRHLAACGAAQLDGGPLVMIQVENETGLLGAARDYSAPAQEAWNEPVPTELLEWFEAHPQAQGVGAQLWRERGCPRGTWAEVFGDDERAAETFMAWGFASYCGDLAAAGTDELNVPYYANAWIGPQPGQDHPGQYPSGGPVAGQVDVWKAAAPSLAFIGPDIYVDDAVGGMDGFFREDNCVVIPESRLAVGNLLWAVGSGAVGFNVFGVDDVRTDGQFATAYGLLAGANDLIVEAQRQGCIRPILLEEGQDACVELGGLTWTLRASTDVLAAIFLDAGVQVRMQATDTPEETTTQALVPSPADMRGMGIMIDLGGDEVLLIGQNLMCEVSGACDEVVEIDDAWEGCYVAGRWVPGRNLNGDERLNLLPIDQLAAVRIRVLRRTDA